MKKIIYIIIITLIIVGLIYTKIKENKYEEIKIEETNINNIEEKENELIKIHIAGAVIFPGVRTNTTAPHPEKQSLFTPARRHCEHVSNN